MAASTRMRTRSRFSNGTLEGPSILHSEIPLTIGTGGQLDRSRPNQNLVDSRTFSAVVGSPQTSSEGDLPVHTGDLPASAGDLLVASTPVSGDTILNSPTIRRNRVEIEDLGSGDDDEHRPWINVNNSNLNRNGNTMSRRSSLDTDQIRTISHALNRMSDAETAAYHKRNASVPRDTDEVNIASLEEIPTRAISKGKGADPKNWGNLGLEDEIDLEEQRAIYAKHSEAYRNLQNQQNGSSAGEEGANDQIPTKIKSKKETRVNHPSPGSVKYEIDEAMRAIESQKCRMLERNERLRGLLEKRDAMQSAGLSPAPMGKPFKVKNKPLLQVLQ